MLRRLLLPLCVALLAVVGLVALWGGGLWLFLDGYALVLVPGLGTLYAFAMFGGRAGVRAFASAFDEGAAPAALRSAKAFFDALGRAYLAFAFLGAIVSFIDMLKNLADRTQLGPRLAVACVSLEYAAILLVFLVLPFRTAVARRLAAEEEGARPRA